MTHLDEDLQGHPDAMQWLAENKAAIATYEKGRQRRERRRVILAMILALWGGVIVTISIFNLLSVKIIADIIAPPKTGGKL